MNTTHLKEVSPLAGDLSHYRYLKETDAATLNSLSGSSLREDRCKGVGISYAKVGRSVYSLQYVLAYMDGCKVETEVRSC